MIGLDAILKIGEKVLDRVMPDPAAKAEAQAKLMELAQKGELANLQAEVDFAKIDAGDRDSARKMQVETHSKIPAILAGITVTGFFIVVGYILTGRLLLTGEQGILVGTIVGYVSAKADQVLSYYLGSSSSSKSKDATIHNMMAK